MYATVGETNAGNVEMRQEEQTAALALNSFR
jgi:hypothetical protein